MKLDKWSSHDILLFNPPWTPAQSREDRSGGLKIKQKSGTNESKDRGETKCERSSAELVLFC